MKMSSFFSTHGYHTPTTRSLNPYTYAHSTSGLSMFDFLLQHPMRFKNFNDAMQARSSQTSLPYDLFPFRERLEAAETSEETVLLVDVGSGMGQATVAIREACRGVKGRMVMQDQREVIEGVGGLPEGVVGMAHDFFTEQPVKGMFSLSPPISITAKPTYSLKHVRVTDNHN